jgi:hypothetical protein
MAAMADYVTLLGAEEVSRAARNIQGAADDLNRALAGFSDTVERLRVVLEEHAARIEKAMEPHHG